MKLALKVSIPVFIVLFYFLSIASAQTGDGIASGKNNAGNNSINTHNFGNQSYNIRVVLDHIFISKKNSSFEISELVVFRNEGDEIYYSKDNHTFFAISTPSDVKNIKAQVMECCLVQEEGIVLMDPMQPVKPGDNFEMQVSYTLLPQSRDYVFNKSTIYNTTSLSIFVDKKGGIGLEELYQTLTLQGNEYDVIAFNDIKAGETVAVPIKMTEKPDYLYAGIGLLSLASVGLVYRFRGKIFRKKRKEYTLEELDLEKRKIFQTMHGFEKHAKPEKSEEYMRLMEEYKQKAIQVFIKIDKIKNKNQEGLLCQNQKSIK